MTQEKVSNRVGKSRTAITNYLRLLKLPAQVQMAIQKKEIDMGHARALLALDSPSLQIKVFREIQRNNYSVRKVEQVVQELKNGEDVTIGKRKISSRKRLPQEYSNTKVQMTFTSTGKGKINIPFTSEEELEHIMRIFDKMK